MASLNSNDALNEKNNKKTQKESDVIILSFLDKSYNKPIPSPTFKFSDKLFNMEKDSEKKGENSENQTNNNNITLITAIYNSLINKDQNSFLFCIQQNNETLIEETIKQMNTDCISKFIEKSIDIFQSNYSNNKSILPWITKLIKLRKIDILSMEPSVIKNLIKLQIYIKEKTKFFPTLCKIKQKIQKLNKTINFEDNKKDKENGKLLKEKNNLNNYKEPGVIEPLLTYIESEDEEEEKERKKKKDKMEEKGFEETENNNMDISEEEEDENENERDNSKESDDEDYLDEEIDNLDIFENNKKNKFKAKNIENENEEEEKNEEGDENDEDDDDSMEQ